MPDPTDSERADWLAAHSGELRAVPAIDWPARFAAAALADPAAERIKRPEPLIDGWMDRGALVWLHGKPGSAKSFLALDMAACVGVGMDWHGSKVHRGPVIYVVAEAVGYLPARLLAWKMMHQVRDTRITWLPMVVALPDPGQVRGFIQWARTVGPVLIVIDTQSRVTPGWADTDARDMSQMIERLDSIRAELRCCVLVVHHQPRNAENLRGSTLLEGAADSILAVTKDGRAVQVRETKGRDSSEDHQLELVLISAGPSAVLSHTLTDVDLQLGPSLLKTLTAVSDCDSEGGVSISRLKAITEQSEATVHRHLKVLRSRGLVYVSRESRGFKYRLTANAEDPLPDL